MCPEKIELRRLEDKSSASGCNFESQLGQLKVTYSTVGGTAVVAVISSALKRLQKSCSAFPRFL